MHRVMSRGGRVAHVAAFIAALSVHGYGETADVNATQIKPAMLQWRIGIGRAEPASDMVEAITRAVLDGRQTWRVTHHAADPARSSIADFDVYDVDAETLAPIRSVMRNMTFELSLSFSSTSVSLRRTEQDTSHDEQIPLRRSVKPDGPGLRVFVASLPLKRGYTTRFETVDRWSGKEAGRVKAVTLSVRDRRRADTALGRQAILEIVMRADDGSFQIVEHVRVRPPHYPFRVEYTRGTNLLVSEVTAMAIQP